MKKYFKPILWIALCLGTGFLSSYLAGSAEVYQTLEKPFFSPPPIVFPIVWTIIYILMGISAYLYSVSDIKNKKYGYTLFFIQLFFNFTWSIVFFRFENLFLSFINILILDLFVYLTFVEFEKANKKAGFYFLIYFFWCLFASLLNFAIFLLN